MTVNQGVFLHSASHPHLQAGTAPLWCPQPCLCPWKPAHFQLQPGWMGDAALYRQLLLKSGAHLAQSPHYGEFSTIVILHALLQLILDREDFNCCGVLHVEFVCKLHFEKFNCRPWCCQKHLLDWSSKKEPTAGSARW